MIIHAPSVPIIIGVLSVMLFLNVVAVALRFYARRGLNQTLKLDDWIMVPAIIGTFGCAACLFHGRQQIYCSFSHLYKEQVFEEDQWVIGSPLS